MNRRHLFDHGFPVSTRTRLAGSAVLLAIANQALRLSTGRIAAAWLRRADTLERVRDSHVACLYTRLLHHAPAHTTHRAITARTEGEPVDGAPGQTAHQP